MAALGALHPRVREGLGELLVLDPSFVSKSGRGTWGTGWFWSGMARAVRWGLEVTLLAAVDVEEGGAYPLCARQSPGRVRSRRQTCGAATGRETTVDVGLSLLREAVAAGAGEILKARWVAADGGYASRTFVEGVRELDLHAVGRLRKDAVLRFPYTGPHERRPGRRRQFDGRFDRRDLTRLACTTLDDEQVDLHHGVLHGKAWQCWLRVVYVLPRGADPQTTEGALLYSTDTELAPERIFRLYGARFQIEFAFRDAKQHLGLHHSQARSQAKLHFHFNIVFAALFWARLQARARAEQSRTAGGACTCLGPGPRPGGAIPRTLFPAPAQAAQLRERNIQTLCRPVGRGPKRRQFRGRPPPHPAGTPVAACTPSRTGAGRTLNTTPQSAWRYDPDLKTVQTIGPWPRAKINEHETVPSRLMRSHGVATLCYNRVAGGTTTYGTDPRPKQLGRRGPERSPTGTGDPVPVR